MRAVVLDAEGQPRLAEAPAPEGETMRNSLDAVADRVDRVVENRQRLLGLDRAIRIDAVAAMDEEFQIQ